MAARSALWTLGSAHSVRLGGAPPQGFARWDGRGLADHLGNVSAKHVWRVLGAHGIHLQRRHNWCVSTDSEFAAKAADIVGLYLDPSYKAMVLFGDEKPAIQALERAQGWLCQEFLAFISEVVAAYPDRQLHVILNNLPTHRPKNGQWLSRHKNVHFHYTPTHLSNEQYQLDIVTLERLNWL